MTAVYWRGFGLFTDSWQSDSSLMVSSAMRPLLGMAMRSAVRCCWTSLSAATAAPGTAQQHITGQHFLQALHGCTCQEQGSSWRGCTLAAAPHLPCCICA